MEAQAQESLDVKLDETNEKLDEMIGEIKKSNQNSEILFWTAFFIGGILAGIAIIFTIRNAQELSKQTKNIEKQTFIRSNVDSANLLFMLSKRIFADFSKTVDLIRDADEGEEVYFDWNRIDRFLGELELVAVLVRTPVIHVEHAYEMFSSIIDKIFDNRQIVDYIHHAQDHEDVELFSGLEWLRDEFKVVKEKHVNSM